VERRMPVIATRAACAVPRKPSQSASGQRKG
jgi:hypothetical protein